MRWWIRWRQPIRHWDQFVITNQNLESFCNDQSELGIIWRCPIRDGDYLCRNWYSPDRQAILRRESAWVTLNLIGRWTSFLWGYHYLIGSRMPVASCRWWLFSGGRDRGFSDLWCNYHSRRHNARGTGDACKNGQKWREDQNVENAHPFISRSFDHLRQREEAGGPCFDPQCLMLPIRPVRIFTENGTCMMSAKSAVLKGFFGNPKLELEKTVSLYAPLTGIIWMKKKLTVTKIIQFLP